MKSATAAMLCAAVALAMCFGCNRSPSSPGSVDVPPVSDQSNPPQIGCPAPFPNTARTTYYIAMNQPGASNDRCDGTSPVDAGNGHCPFKDFGSGKTFGLLRNVSSVRVEVRTGIYTFPSEALSLEGGGTSDADRVVLTAYQNESVVFDGRGTLREVIRLGGRFTGVEKVTIRNSAGYNLQIGGGNDHIVQCNRFQQNVASDSLKGTDGATHALIRHNDFSGWDSQAIDMAGIRDFRIEDNDFHDPKDSTGNAFGAKFGSRDVVATGNRIRNTRGIALGGVSANLTHPDDYEAYNFRADGNTFDNVTGAIVRFYSCLNCSFSDNTARAVGGGFVLFGEQTDGPSSCTGGCKPTQGASIFRNRLTDLRGNPSNTFWGLYTHEAGGLTAGNNVYCTPANQDGRFRLDDKDLSFSQFVAAVGTDSSSTTGLMNQGVCGF